MAATTTPTRTSRPKSTAPTATRREAVLSSSDVWTTSLKKQCSIANKLKVESNAMEIGNEDAINRPDEGLHIPMPKIGRNKKEYEKPLRKLPKPQDDFEQVAPEEMKGMVADEWHHIPAAATTGRWTRPEVRRRQEPINPPGRWTTATTSTRGAVGARPSRLNEEDAVLAGEELVRRTVTSGRWDERPVSAKAVAEVTMLLQQIRATDMVETFLPSPSTVRTVRIQVQSPRYIRRRSCDGCERPNLRLPPTSRARTLEDGRHANRTSDPSRSKAMEPQGALGRGLEAGRFLPATKGERLSLVGPLFATERALLRRYSTSGTWAVDAGVFELLGEVLDEASQQVDAPTGILVVTRSRWPRPQTRLTPRSGAAPRAEGETTTSRSN